MLIEDAMDMLGRTPPFQFLDQGLIKSVARLSSLGFFPKGNLILTGGGEPARHLHVIVKGLARVSPAGKAPFAAGQGREDYPGEGEMFGYLSLMSGSPPLADVWSEEDTLCLLLPRLAVELVLKAEPGAARFFLKAMDHGFMDKTFEERRRRAEGPGLWGAGPLLALAVGEVVNGECPCASVSLSVQEAARLMTERGRSSLVLVDSAGAAVGMVTDHDFRAKVAAGGVSPDAPVEGIMSRPVVAMEAKAPCMEALLTMLGQSIHHVLVVGEAGPVGVVASHDLMMLQGASPLALARRIDQARDWDELAQAAQGAGGSGSQGGLDGLVGLLLREGARASVVTRLASEISDRVVRRVVDLGVAEVSGRLGPPPLPFALLVFGSEGRKEQGYRTDQDNALVWADPSSEEQARDAQAWFAELAGLVARGLEACGYPPCPARYMAANPAWRMDLSAFKRTFTRWIANPEPEAVLGATILFDFRHVAGDPSLAESLRDHLHAHVEAAQPFLGFLARAAVANRPPVGLLGSFVVDKAGAHKDAFNIKVKGIAPLVDMIRLFALERSVRQTSTMERLDRLAGVHAIAAEYESEIRHGFEFLLAMRLYTQRATVEAGLPPGNHVNPSQLTPLERRTLKQVFNLVSRLQDVVVERYRPFIW